MANHIEKYITPTYDDAIEEMKTLLKEHGGIIILVDSVERYEFEDRVILAILNSLATLCVDYGRENNDVTFKMAAPSELIPRLLSINPEKITSKTVYIRWSHDDLKKFVSVRLYRHIMKIDRKTKISFQMALDFFDSYYDKECMTRCGFYFPTFSYCMAHTLKEPRHILSIFNAWLYYERKRNVNRMSLVDSAIDCEATTRVKGALSIYTSVHPNMDEMFFRTFANRKFCFSEEEFDEWVACCSNIRGELDAYDLKKYFVSSGLVGTMIDLHYIVPGEGRINVDRPVRIKEVVFEYQVKERLLFNSGTKFCLHPMVYQALNIEVDRNTFVYPKPVEFAKEFVPWDNNK